MPGRTAHDVGEYYDASGVGWMWELERDHLSPMLSNRDEYALDVSRWRDGVSERVLRLAERMGIGAGDRVLDLGAGLGGPGRDIAAATGCSVHGLTVSEEQADNLRRISEETGSAYTDVRVGDMQQLEASRERFDHAFSINSLYHAGDPEAVIRGVAAVVRPGGRFGLDDWFTTRRTTPVVRDGLRKRWSTEARGFHDFERVETLLERNRLKVIETLDYTEGAGAFLSEERFGTTYDSQAVPRLLTAFPQLYGREPDHARQAVRQLREAILYMGELYRSGQAVYRQVIAQVQG